MFLTNFNSSVEFAICWGILSGEQPYHMESSPLICNIKPLARFYIVGDFYGGFSQADCDFNFNINVNVTVDSYISSCFNFSFSYLLNYLLSFRIMKLESTTKITAQFETILQCLLFLSLLFPQSWNQIQFFTLHFIYICNKLVIFHSNLLCKFFAISKFKVTLMQVRKSTNIFVFT